MYLAVRFYFFLTVAILFINILFDSVTFSNRARIRFSVTHWRVARWISDVLSDDFWTCRSECRLGVFDFELRSYRLLSNPATRTYRMHCHRTLWVWDSRWSVTGERRRVCRFNASLANGRRAWVRHPMIRPPTSTSMLLAALAAAADWEDRAGGRSLGRLIGLRLVRPADGGSA